MRDATNPRRVVAELPQLPRSAAVLEDGVICLEGVELASSKLAIRFLHVTYELSQASQDG